MGFYEAWHGAVDPGGEEVWDFMRLSMGQGGGCGSKDGAASCLESV